MKPGVPITPDQLAQVKAKIIPSQVIDVWNECIAKHATNGRSYFGQKAIVQLLSERLNVPPGEVYNNHWLDVEELYRASGWTVVYDRPAYNETYEANFTFTAAKK